MSLELSQLTARVLRRSRTLPLSQQTTIPKLVASLLASLTSLVQMELSLSLRERVLRLRSNMLKVLSGTEDIFHHTSLQTLKLRSVSSRTQQFFSSIRKSAVSRLFFHISRLVPRSKSHSSLLLKMSRVKLLPHLW